MTVILSIEDNSVWFDYFKGGNNEDLCLLKYDEAVQILEEQTFRSNTLLLSSGWKTECLWFAAWMYFSAKGEESTSQQYLLCRFYLLPWRFSRQTVASSNMMISLPIVDNKIRVHVFPALTIGNAVFCDMTKPCFSHKNRRLYEHIATIFRVNNFESLWFAERKYLTNLGEESLLQQYLHCRISLLPWRCSSEATASSNMLIIPPQRAGV